MKVSWDENVCIHAGKCVGGAPEVFKIEDGKFVIDTDAALLKTSKVSYNKNN